MTVPVPEPEGSEPEVAAPQENEAEPTESQAPVETPAAPERPTLVFNIERRTARLFRDVFIAICDGKQVNFVEHPGEG